MNVNDSCWWPDLMPFVGDDIRQSKIDSVKWYLSIVPLKVIYSPFILKQWTQDK